MTPIEALDTYGWIKGHYQNEQGICMLGAWRVSRFGRIAYLDRQHEREQEEVGQQLGKVAEELFPGRAGEHEPWAASFNDHPDTTLEDVKLVFKHYEGENDSK